MGQPPPSSGRVRKPSTELQGRRPRLTDGVPFLPGPTPGRSPGMHIAHPKDKRFFRVWPIALAGFALASAGLACSVSSLGGGSSKDYTATFDGPANPLPVRPELDPAGDSRAVIAAPGGALEATGSDGARSALSIPEGALPLGDEVSLTPVRSVA